MDRSTIAAELARARWDGTTKAERKEHSDVMNAAKMKATTKAQRKAAARKAAAARWGKKKGASK